MGYFFTPSLGLLAVVSVLVLAGLAAETPTLTTTLGPVNGIQKRMFKKDVEVFYGIPYAKAPTGNRRFRPPRTADAWTEPRDGSVKPPACFQTVNTKYDQFEGVEMWNPNTEMSEDCLFLNVWRRVPKKGDQKKKRIMVWIHGGKFSSGSALLDVYDASQIAVRENVIVVSIAYRLGPLGFMYVPGGEDPAPGNAGLFDQVEALKWVRDNAENLGGSPDAITIFGQGAGAVSVGFHMLSPESRDLFQYAIMLSGSPTTDWGLNGLPETARKVSKLAAEVDCADLTEDKLLECLRGVDAQALTDAQWSITNKWFDVPIGPVVDGDFLPSKPEDMIAEGDIKNTSVIIGVTLNEGMYWNAMGFTEDFPLVVEFKMSTERYEEILSTVTDGNEELETQLLRVYSQEFKDAKERRLRILDSTTGDLLVKCSVVDFARMYTDMGGKVYLYSFEEKLTTNPWPGWMGVPHGYDTNVLFGHLVTKGSENTQKEKALSKEFMQLFVNFAKKGRPKYKDVKWPRYTTDKEDYVKIDEKKTRVARRLRKQVCEVVSQYQ